MSVCTSLSVWSRPSAFAVLRALSSHHVTGHESLCKSCLICLSRVGLRARARLLALSLRYSRLCISRLRSLVRRCVSVCPACTSLSVWSRPSAFAVLRALSSHHVTGHESLCKSCLICLARVGLRARARLLALSLRYSRLCISRLRSLVLKEKLSAQPIEHRRVSSVRSPVPEDIDPADM